MFDAFTNKADLTPYNAVSNQVPLTEGVKTAPACGPDALGQTGAAAAAVNTNAAKAASVPAPMQDIAEQWDTWSTQQHLTGNGAKEDFANPYLFNRWTWYQTHHWQSPYPGDAKIYGPNNVPGIPAGSAGHEDGGSTPNRQTTAGHPSPASHAKAEGHLRGGDLQLWDSGKMRRHEAFDQTARMRRSGPHSHCLGVVFLLHISLFSVKMDT